METGGTPEQDGPSEESPHQSSLTKYEKFATNTFKEIYMDRDDNPYHIDIKEQEMAYKRLMDHVDGIEKRKRKECNYYLKRGAAVILFSGLTATLVCSLTVEPTNHWRLLKQRMWQWVTMTMMITGVFSIVPFLTFLAFWPFKRIFRTHKYAVYFLRRMKRSLDVTLWACLVLLGWYAWFRRRLKHVHGDLSVIIVSQITRLLIALCIGCLLWSVKNVLHLKLKADLHYDQLFDRITQTIVYLNGIYVLNRRKRQRPEKTDLAPFLTYRNKTTEPTWTSKQINKIVKIPILKVIGKIRGELLKLPSKICCVESENGHQEGCPKADPVNYIWMDVLKMKREKAPIWILRGLSEEYLIEVKHHKPTHADELIKHDHKLLEEANKMLELIVSPDNDSEITRSHLKYEGYRLSKTELDHFFKRRRFEAGGKNKKQDSTDHQQPHGDKNKEQDSIITDHQQPHGNGQPKEETSSPKQPESDERVIHADKFLNWAVRAHKNCWSLECTLKSSKIAFNKLNRMLSAFLLVLVIIIWLLLSKIVNTGQLALLFAPFLAASFMFENSSMKMFHGIIFAFAMHPFDVGDRVIIEDTQMRVKVMHILTSVFVKYDTGAEVIFPNSKLATTKIINLDITPDQSDQLDFIIDIKTPLEDVKDLELQIQKLLDDDIFYASGTKVVKSSNQNPENKEELKMIVHFKYLVSYLTAETKATHRSDILTMIMKLSKMMKENRKEFPLHYVPFDLELKTPKNLKTSGIDHLKRKILWSLSLAPDEWKGVQDTSSLRPKEGKYKYCKAVMTDLKDDHIKIALFVSKSEKDMPPQDIEDKVTEDLKSNGFFTYIDHLLREREYTMLKVSRDEHSIYSGGSKWVQAAAGLKFNGSG